MPLWCVLFPGTPHLEPYKPVAQYALNPIMVRTVSGYVSVQLLLLLLLLTLSMQHIQLFVFVSALQLAIGCLAQLVSKELNRTD
jgi:hypothetical protein